MLAMESDDEIEPYKKEPNINNNEFLEGVLRKIVNEDPDLLIEMCLEMNQQVNDLKNELEDLKERLPVDSKQDLG
jgi:hypothetical protein